MKRKLRTIRRLPRKGDLIFHFRYGYLQIKSSHADSRDNSEIFYKDQCSTVHLDGSVRAIMSEFILYSSILMKEHEVAVLVPKNVSAAMLRYNHLRLNEDYTYSDFVEDITFYPSIKKSDDNASYIVYSLMHGYCRMNKHEYMNDKFQFFVLDSENPMFTKDKLWFDSYGKFHHLDKLPTLFKEELVYLKISAGILNDCENISEVPYYLVLEAAINEGAYHDE